MYTTTASKLIHRWMNQILSMLPGPFFKVAICDLESRIHLSSYPIN
jgi:hypothetical protein